MTQKHGLFSGPGADRRLAPVITGLVLFFVSYGTDLVTYVMGVKGAETIFNNLLIGLAGAGLVIFFQSVASHDEARARIKGQRSILAGELNHRIRLAMLLVRQSATLEDQDERGRLIAEAVEQMDKALNELIPYVAGAEDVRELSNRQKSA
jgi:uncharacterized membrane protein YuzA (DUF378 family)